MVGALQRRGALALAILAILAAVAAGFALRLSDPVENPTIPAEDPFTHMALTREHLRDGEFDPLYEGSTMYPPGLHALLGAVVAFTGYDLYDVVLWGPVVFGALGILGLALFVGRSEGYVAGFVAAIAIAVTPEAVFRSQMMSPTALDLAILPFLLFAFVEVLRGRLAWIGAAIPLALFLVLSHPWLYGILAVTGAAFLVLTLLLPWRPERAPPVTGAGLAACMAIVGVGLGMSLSGCGGGCGPGFDELVDVPLDPDLDWLPTAIIAVSLLPAALALLVPRSRRFLAPSPKRRELHWSIRAALSFALAALVYGVTRAASQGGYPDYVELPRMVGKPILLLAAAGFVALPWVRSPASLLGGAMAAATYPFVVFNPLKSEFWPHRTAVYLAFALAILCGVAASAAVQLTTWTVQRLTERAARKRPAALRARPVLLAVPVLLVGAAMGGGVYAQTPDVYETGWERLYNECEMDALRDVAAMLNDDPSLLLITGDWQSKLVLAALADDAGRVWFDGDFYRYPERRETLVAQKQHEGTPMVVLVSRYLKQETPDADTSFAQSPPFEPAGSWCAGMGVEQARMEAYRVGVPS